MEIEEQGNQPFSVFNSVLIQPLKSGFTRGTVDKYLSIHDCLTECLI